VVGVLSSVAALLQQILTALLNIGAGIASPIVSAVTSALSGFMPLLSGLNLATLNLGTIAELLAGLVPNLGTMAGAVGASGSALAATLDGVGSVVSGLLNIQPPTATVAPIAAAATTTAGAVNQLVNALSSGTLIPRATTVNAPITVISAVTGTPDRIARRLLALTG
jgi:phage-related protein